MLCCVGVGVATLPSVGWLCLIRRSKTCYCCYCMLCRCSHPPFGWLAVPDKMFIILLLLLLAICGQLLVLRQPPAGGLRSEIPAESTMQYVIVQKRSLYVVIVLVRTYGTTCNVYYWRDMPYGMQDRERWTRVVIQRKIVTQGSCCRQGCGKC